MAPSVGPVGYSSQGARSQADIGPPSSRSERPAHVGSNRKARPARPFLNESPQTGSPLPAEQTLLRRSFQRAQAG